VLRSALLLFVLALLACNKGVTLDFKHKRPAAAAAGGRPVASWSGDSITDAELKVRFAEMSPYQRARYQTVEQRREYVDGLARFELLAQEAVKRGLANDPDVVETAKKVMVQRLLQEEMDAKKLTVPQGAIQEYYDKHKGDFVKPAMTRLSHVFFKKEDRARAEATLKEALQLQQLDYAGFAKLARERSQEPRTQPLEGDLRFLSDEDLSAQYGAQLVEAQKELAQVGQVLPRLVETDAGLHVIRLQGRQVALNLTVDKVKEQIQSTLINDLKQDRYRALLEELKKSAGYKVDDAALGALELDVKAPALESKGPTPGFVPAPEAKRPEK
jgi:peptidyl-prolyl cis-trans isomerase C